MKRLIVRQERCSYPFVFYILDALDTPFFSVVIPTYNRGGVLLHAIQSVIQQTFDQWELIIVDDGSKDDTKSVVSAITDKRVKYFYQENKGRSAARNAGIEKALGEYIAFLDSDDQYAENYLELFFAEISQEKGPHLCFSSAEVVGNSNPYLALPYSNNPTLSNQEKLLITPMATPRAVIHQSCFELAQFPLHLVFAEDRHLFVILASTYPVLYCPKAIVYQYDYGDRSVNSMLSYTKEIFALQELFALPQTQGIRRSIRHRVLTLRRFFELGLMLKRGDRRAALQILFSCAFREWRYKFRLKLNLLCGILSSAKTESALAKVQQLLYQENLES